MNLGGNRTIHLIGICGTGMGSLAGILKAQGFAVRGSDEDPQPPIATMLESQGIPVVKGYRPGNLEPAPDIVVVGNVVSRSNPEVVALLERKLPYLSMPQALGEFVLSGRHPIVVAGTHGKTTTSAMLSHVLMAAGKDPSYFVGGVLRDGETSFRIGSGPHVVVEGDEYETSFFDKGPKLLHYRPRTAILTSVEYDHAEMFSSLDAIADVFRSFLKLVPADGTVIACADDPLARKLAEEAAGSAVILYGLRGGDLQARITGESSEGTRFEIVAAADQAEFSIPLSGEHNVLDALAALGAARTLGLNHAEIASGLASFPGVHRRQEVLGEAGGVTVLDDFAHHPTAVRETVRAVRARYPGRRLWAVFEPRTNTSRRSVFQSHYSRAFDGADITIIAAVHHPEKVPEGQRLDVLKLVEEIRERELEAHHIPGTEEIVAQIAREALPGDVVLIMSNGTFGGIHRKLLAALAERPTRRP